MRALINMLVTHLFNIMLLVVVPDLMKFQILL